MTRTHEKPRALIADDDPGQRLLMEQVLTQAGLSVVAVPDGAAAIATATAGAFDIIFLDVNMPAKTGLEACRAITTALGASCPPIIMVTSRDSDDAITAGFAAGATDYLIKPVNWMLFQHRVNGWLRPHGSGRPGVPPEKLDRKLLITRGGDILADSHAADDATDHPGELSKAVAPGLAEQIMVCVRKVLKTRAPTSCRFAEWEASVEAQGREKASVVLRSINSQAAEAAELYRLAYMDPVTDLPNRHLFERGAKAALVDAQLRGLGLSVLCITIHPARTGQPNQPPGKEALRSLAQQLVLALRTTDYVAGLDGRESGDSPVASIDGAHFLVLLTDTTAADATATVVERIRKACGQFTPHVGIARFPDDATDLSQLVELAIVAASAGGNRRDGGPNRATAQLPRQVRDDLAGELRQALARNEICLYFQPRVDLDTRQVVGAEALLRWQHPLRGPVTASELIATADDAGETRALMDLAVDRACRQAADWASRLATRFPLSINASSKQLARADFAGGLVALLARLGLDPALIEIEVAESSIDAGEAVLAQLLELRNAGVGLIVDDFGVGHASLATLRRLRIDGFKIDHSQVRAAGWSQEESGVYTMAASIARVRHAWVIAKRIETAGELAAARAGGCDQVQGYFVCQPLPPAQFEQYVATAGCTLGMTTSPGLAI
jgi:EAL domain-containing protein (putative c-di-GMP-specific phosphodiesterase class I)/PleD family two-component response regulator